MTIPFVGRDREVRRLVDCLEQSGRETARTCFIAGAAGAGKSTLIEAFAARAQAADAQLAIAVGACNAQTGIGDPYLPFLDVLQQLTGNVDSKLEQGVISQQNASRLRRIGQTAADVLIDIAPDLIGTFIPGASLVVAVARKAAEKAGVFDKMKDRFEGTAPAAIDQQRIMESYTAVVRQLAARVPLVLVLDDLQWADAASCALLFHLAQNLKDARLLLIGTYRANDVALGRAGDRHPLTQVLNELKRYHGDIVIDLDALGDESRRAFVSAIIDSEPNELGPAFREALHRHTRGHALFTVELLRALQERECIVQSERGTWVATEGLDWGVLPSRVEGVIEERIGRLQEEVRQILGIASVEGESFTVEIVARLGEISERALLKTLSTELEKRHQLVTEGDVQKVGRNWVSHYYFTHALVHQYLYNGLSRREKMLLHGEVASILEELYAGQLELVTVQLARHWCLAGEEEKAFGYSNEAAQRALRIGAFTEALQHLDAALALVPELPAADRASKELDVQVGRAAATKALKGWDDPHLIEIYGRCRELAETSEPTAQIAPILFGLWAINLLHTRIDQAWEIATECLAVGEKLGSDEVVLQARIAQANTRYWMGDFVSTVQLTDEAMELAKEDSYAERLGQDPRSLILMFAMFASWMTGSDGASAHHRRDLIALVDRLGHPFTTAIALQGTAWQSCHDLDPATALVESGKLIRLATEHQFPFYLAIGKIFHGWASIIDGRDARAEVEEGYAVVSAFGGQILDSLHSLIRGECCLVTGDIEGGVAVVEAAIPRARSTGFAAYLAELHRVHGELLAARDDVDGAAESFRAAIEVAADQQAIHFEERAFEALARLSLVTADQRGSRKETA